MKRKSTNSIYTIENIIDFLKEETGMDQIHHNTEVCDGIGLIGDDFHEMIEKFAQNFNVDLTDYLWYFHTEDEPGLSIGSLFFDPPFTRVKRIPVLVTDLLEFANQGKWNIKYPEHQLPKRRYDLMINATFVIITLLFIIFYLINKFTT